MHRTCCSASRLICPGSRCVACCFRRVEERRGGQIWALFLFGQTSISTFILFGICTFCLRARRQTCAPGMLMDVNGFRTHFEPVCQWQGLDRSMIAWSQNHSSGPPACSLSEAGGRCCMQPMQFTCPWRPVSAYPAYWLPWRLLASGL